MPSRAVESRVEPSSALFHITHWKAGSQWLRKILSECCPERIVSPGPADQSQFFRCPLLAGGVYPTVYVTREQFESVQMPPTWRRFVVIRDLRDTLISMYFSMKFSHKEITPGIAIWRAKLRSVSMERGLMLLLGDWLPYSAAIQRSWVKAGEALIRYEDLLERDQDILEDVLLRKCNLAIPAERFREVVKNSRFSECTGGRQRGQENLQSHNRKGVAGDWRNHFSDRLARTFRDHYGELLVATGYEQNANW